MENEKAKKEYDVELTAPQSDKAVGSVLNNGEKDSAGILVNKNDGAVNNKADETAKSTDILPGNKSVGQPSSDEIMNAAKKADQPWNGNNDGNANKLRRETGDQ